MVAGRTDGGIGGPGAAEHQVRRGQRGVDRGPSSLVGPGPDRRHRVDRVLPDLGPDGRGPPAGPLVEEVRDRRRAGRAPGRGRLPASRRGPGAGRRGSRGVDGQHRGVAVVGGGLDVGAGGDHGVVQGVAPGRRLVGRQLHPEPDAATDVVAAMALVPDHGHRQRRVTIPSHERATAASPAGPGPRDHDRRPADRADEHDRRRARREGRPRDPVGRRHHPHRRDGRAARRPGRPVVAADGRRLGRAQRDRRADRRPQGGRVGPGGDADPADQHRGGGPGLRRRGRHRVRPASPKPAPTTC